MQRDPNKYPINANRVTWRGSAKGYCFVNLVWEQGPHLEHSSFPPQKLVKHNEHYGPGALFTPSDNYPFEEDEITWSRRPSLAANEAVIDFPLDSQHPSSDNLKVASPLPSNIRRISPHGSTVPIINSLISSTEFSMQCITIETGFNYISIFLLKPKCTKQWPLFNVRPPMQSASYLSPRHHHISWAFHISTLYLAWCNSFKSFITFTHSLLKSSEINITNLHCLKLSPNPSQHGIMSNIINASVTSNAAKTNQSGSPQSSPITKAKDSPPFHPPYVTFYPTTLISYPSSIHPSTHPLLPQPLTAS